jgi:branched-chain amino acid transport system permease protein
VVVWGLSIDESSRFVSYLAFVGFAAAVAYRLGAFGYAQALGERHRTIAVTAALITAVAFPFTQNGDAYWLRVFASIGVFAAAAIGLNVVVGLAGLLDLGYIAFFGVGAYVGALFSNAAFTTVHVHVPFILVVLMGACISALFGLIIGAPTLRLRGDYLAIVTLGFGEIFRIVANQWDGLTRGPNGISGVPDLAIGSTSLGDSHTVLGVPLPGFANYYFVELVLLICVIVIFTRLNGSRIGRAWVAIREDETAAAAMGVDTVRLKLLAFAIGAFLAGAAGTVNAHVGRSVTPDSYTFLESIFLLAAVVLGGMGTVPGALLGSAVLFIIPEKLRSFQDKRLLLFGAALVLMMRFRPEGIAASRRRQRELREADGGAGAQGAVPGAPVTPS